MDVCGDVCFYRYISVPKRINAFRISRSRVTHQTPNRLLLQTNPTTNELVGVSVWISIGNLENYTHTHVEIAKEQIKNPKTEPES